MCRAIETHIATAPQFPSEHLLCNVDFDGHYLGENRSQDGMFTNHFSHSYLMYL